LQYIVTAVVLFDTFSHSDMYIRGVFKKRLNFVNLVPTSTENTLQLLSSPSVRF